MRKLAVLSFLVLGLIASGATPAHAAGPFCIHLTNFCDTLTETTDSVNNTYGTWDWTCDGVDLTSVIGQQSVGLIYSATRPVAGGVPFNYSTNFVFHKQNALFDLWGTDGTFKFAFQISQPYSISAGSCFGSGPRTGKPSLGKLQ